MSTHQTSLDPKIPAIQGDSPNGGAGVLGISALGHGVRGESTSSRGVVGVSVSFHGVFGTSGSNVGVAGESQGSNGVWGVSHDPGHAGVHGFNQAGRGVAGFSDTFQGVYGHSGANAGVVGESDTFDGVWGVAQASNKAGVYGFNKAGRGVAGFSDMFQGVYGHSGANAGVVGESDTFDGVWGVARVPGKAGVYGLNEAGGRGVAGFSDTFQGVYGHSDGNVGVVGESKNFDGIWGVAHVKECAGVVGRNTAGGVAGYFEGDVVVTRELTLSNADFAEDFDIAGNELVDPGTVLVLGDAGGLQASATAYDKRVAGVVSGAGRYRPGIVLDKVVSTSRRQPVALVGKVCCKADARFGAIAIGDLLTTSPTPGHAMKADDRAQAFGAVIGKALAPLADGQGLVPILIALQ